MSERRQRPLSERPKWLPATGPGNLNVSPDMWGMTLSQWCAFIMACKVCNREKWMELCDSTERKEAGYVNLYQICDNYVKPWTRNCGNSIALLLNGDKPLNAEVMISHAWGEDIIESMVAILGRSSVCGMSMETAVWFCTFAQYQPGDMEGDCGPGVAAQLALDPFKVVIASQPRFGMLVIHTSVVDLYGRLWCVYEVNASQDANVPTSCASSVKYFNQNKKKIGYDDDDSEEVFAVKAEEAACWSPDDAKTIRGQIEAGIGYEKLNLKIAAFRKASYDRMVTALCEIVSGLTHMETFSPDPYGVTDKALVPAVSAASQFIGLSCLVNLSEAHEDEAYLLDIMHLLRDTSEIYKDSHMDMMDFSQTELRDGSIIDALSFGPIEVLLSSDRSEWSGGVPPGFDPAKGLENQDKLRDLKDDDELLLSCLRDLNTFPQPLGWVEMSAGGEIGEKAAEKVLAEINVKRGDADPEATEKLKAVFRQWDTDGDGIISREELGRIMKELDPSFKQDELEVMFQACDANQDGVIDYSEFINWLFDSKELTT